MLQLPPPAKPPPSNKAALRRERDRRLRQRRNLGQRVISIMIDDRVVRWLEHPTIGGLWPPREFYSHKQQRREP